MRDLDLGLAPGGSPPSSSSRSVGSQSAPPVYSRPNLVAYYKFDEPKDGTSNVAIWGHHSKAHDYSGNGNDLLLGAPPTLARVEGAPADGADGTASVRSRDAPWPLLSRFELRRDFGWSVFIGLCAWVAVGLVPFPELG